MFKIEALFPEKLQREKETRELSSFLLNSQPSPTVNLSAYFATLNYCIFVRSSFNTWLPGLPTHLHRRVATEPQSHPLKLHRLGSTVWSFPPQLAAYEQTTARLISPFNRSMSMEQRKTVLKREERRKELRRVEESTKKAAGLALIYERQSSEETGWDPLQSFRVGSDETLQVFLGRSSDDCFRTRPINQMRRRGKGAGEKSFDQVSHSIEPLAFC